ncbi:Lipase 1-like Protein [Tribolium castaneum]|uniref:Lipase n=2 Tax=Tribolium castaneum TaxID=7070 RepID=A0A139WHC6_TRICA|nr:Lipase 1-like Protein [Tribolium castaneum]
MPQINLLQLFCIIIFVQKSESVKNNVCKTIMDYLLINYNQNCWYNPDVGSPARDIITRRGYPLETYYIQTEDGYINGMYRVPHNNTHTNMKERQPILLHPGLSGSPNSFLYIGNRSIVFFLVNNGYDVWLPHRRGSAYGRGHIKYKRTDPEFWDYSYHECGNYDITAEIDFIKTKNPRKVILFGYSMGTTETYVYAILRKEHAKRHITGIVSAGVTAYVEHPNRFYTQISLSAAYVQNSLRFRRIHGLYDGWETRQRADDITFTKIVGAKKSLMALFGDNPDQVDPADLPVYIADRPSSTAVKCYVHYAQNIIAKKFQFYDYGLFKNVLLYNSTSPPLYNVSEIDVPMYLFYGESDTLNPKEDVAKFYNDLKVKKKALIHISEDKKVKFNHADFVLGKDVHKLFYGVLLRTLRENLKG